MNKLDKLNIDENCKNVKELPKLTFVLDNVHYDLDANDYVMKIDSDGNEVNKRKNTKHSLDSLLNIC